MAILSHIFIYPIKSTAPIRLQEAQVQAEGLARDRRYIVTDEQGRFFTARRFPRMVLIQSELNDWGLRVNAPQMPTLDLVPADFRPDYQPVQVWKDTVDGQRCGDVADRWFSDYLGVQARLYYMGEKSHRPLRTGGVVSFADAAPLLLLSEESVTDLNTRLETPVELRNFRANLVVTGCDAYAEDDWPGFNIGEVDFKTLWRCSRCILTTVHPDTATMHPDRQPLATLMDYRLGPDNEAYFGQNVGAVNTGLIRTGQPLGIHPGSVENRAS